MATLLPRLALSLDHPAPPDLGSLFARPVTAVGLEIGFGGGENLISEASAHPQSGLSAANPSSTARQKSWPSSRRGPTITSGCMPAMRSNCWAGFRMPPWRGWICCTPTRGRNDGTGSAASCRTVRSLCSHVCCNRGACSASLRTFPTTPPGHWNASCARRTSSGRPRVPMTRASLGTGFAVRATRPRPDAQVGRHATWNSTARDEYRFRCGTKGQRLPATSGANDQASGAAAAGSLST